MSPTLDSEDLRKTLIRSLAKVGPTKPVGYLPLYSIRDFAQLSPEMMAEQAIVRGLVAVQFGPDTCCIKSGALYIYDREALAMLLQANAGAVFAAGLSGNPDRFVEQIAAVWYDEDHPAYRVIASAFGNVI